jgi:ATP-dependent DNA helicase 2 subunit 1
MTQRAGDYVLSWAEELEKQYDKIPATSGVKTTLAKRPAKDTSASGPPAKKAKAADGGAASDPQAEVQKHFQKGTLSKLTVSVLKDYLASQGRSSAGKKADLVEQVEELLESKV